MSRKTTPLAKAVQAIDAAGILLVFPIKNERAPASLWYALYPKSGMRWDWSEDADERVVNLWHLRTELSQCRDVVYTKWFRGRATFFSRSVFVAMLRGLESVPEPRRPEGEAAAVYDALLEDSPQTVRMLRAAVGLEGKVYEGTFTKALKQLWDRLLTVGFGEVDEGAFPALAIGATRLLFEELWDEAAALSADLAQEVLAEAFAKPGAGPFAKYYARLVKKHIPERFQEPARKGGGRGIMPSNADDPWSFTARSGRVLKSAMSKPQ